MSLLQETASFQEHVPVTKKVHGLMAEDEEEECPLFVGSVTSEVQIQNIE